MSSPRECACGCGVVFEPKNSQQMYSSMTCSFREQQRRSQVRKEQGRLALVEDQRCTPETAAMLRRAWENLDEERLGSMGQGSSHDAIDLVRFEPGEGKRRWLSVIERGPGSPSVCPTCGERATIERCPVTRAGERQVMLVLRCWRQGTKRRPSCPPQIRVLHEGEDEAQAFGGAA